MRTSLLLTFLSGCLIASAGSICPGATTGTTFTHPPDPTGTGCNVVITINANGSASTAITDATPYEGSEDVLVGVLNNSATPITKLTLNGNGNNIFFFEGDGVCTFSFPNNGYCTTASTGYEGPTSTFSAISTDQTMGTVNFAPAIAGSGGSTFFSLEGIPTANLSTTVNNGAPPPSSTATAPTLGEWGMILLGALLIGSAAILIGRKATV